MLITISPETLSLEAGSEIILRHKTWEDYEDLLAIRQDKNLSKLYFNAKTQEIRLISPLASHGKRVDTLRDLVKALLNFEGKDWECFDPIPLKQLQRAGVEPDTCFYIENRQVILGKERINLTVDPPPDLAIEVDFTSVTNLGSYSPLAIPELWIYSPGDLKIYIFENDDYQEKSQSNLFKNWDIKTLFPNYVEMAWFKGSSVSLRVFEEDILK
jgi:Uma2 family endonuclease